MKRRLKTLLAMFGFYVLLLAVGDAALRLLFLVKDAVRPESVSGPYEPRAYLAAYEGADYDAVAMWREIKLGTAQWLNYQPYTVWTRKPIRGDHVNVDEQGYRVTRFNSTDPEALRIWMIGGSTTWGMGVPDQETIPSQLARHFNEWGVETQVLNLGHTGFVSTQEVITLLRELQARPAPDIFVVYDGLNEGLGLAERPDLPNPHYLMGRVSDLFESRDVAAAPGTVSLLLGVAKTTGYYRLATALRGRILPDRTRQQPVTQREAFSNDSPVPTVASRSVDILLENYALMTALGDEVGFPCFFFFQYQPGVGLKPLHDSEEQVLAKVAENPEEHWILQFAREQRRLFRARLAAGATPARVYDLSDMFAMVSRPLFIDWAHLTHAGNRLVAERLFERIRQQVCAGELVVGDVRLQERLLAACGEQSADRKEH